MSESPKAEFRETRRPATVVLDPAAKSSSMQAVNRSDQGSRVDRPVLTNDDYVEHEEGREDYVLQDRPSSHL